MPQSLSQVLVHAVFSTKNREPMIPRLHAYLATVLNDIDCPSLQVGGTADHIHALFALSRTHTIANVIKEIKIVSSQWMKQQLGTAFWWQAGYGTFSVASSQKSRVIKSNISRPRNRITVSPRFRMNSARSSNAMRSHGTSATFGIERTSAACISLATTARHSACVV